jgi:hypothetical protein
MNETLSGTSFVDPDEIAQHLIQKAHNQDGLPDILTGLIFVLMAALNYLSPYATRAPGAYGAAILISMALCFGGVRLIPWVRRRFLIGRVGYVQFSAEKRKAGRGKVAWIVIAGTFIFVVLLGAAFEFRELPIDRWVVAAFGLYFGAIRILIGRSARVIVISALGAIAGLALAFGGFTPEQRVAHLFAALGLISLVSGLIGFLRLICQPVEAAQ